MPYHGILRSLRDKSLEKNWGCLYLYSVEKASMKDIGNLSSTSRSPSAEQSDSCHFRRQGPPCRGIMYLHAVDWLWPVKCGWKRDVSLQGERTTVVCGSPFPSATVTVSVPDGTHTSDLPCEWETSPLGSSLQYCSPILTLMCSTTGSLDFFPQVMNPYFFVKYFKKLVMNSNHMCVCVCSVVSDSVTLWTVAHQAPLSVEFSRQEYWSRLPYPTPGDLPDPGIEPKSPASPALAGGFFTTAPPGKPVYRYEALRGVGQKHAQARGFPSQS